MTERKPSIERQAVYETVSARAARAAARASGNPFNEIRDQIAASPKDKLRRETLDQIVDYLRGAERHYTEGNMYDAVLGVWEVASLGFAFTEMKAPRIMRQKRKAPTASGKANTEAAWRRAYNTHPSFRLWNANAQANYLTANYSKDVKGIKRESLEKYIRAFRKKA